MYLKTIWNSGDIITTEKWNNITDNLYQQYSYIIPNDFEVVDNDYSLITIPMTYKELIKKIDQYGKTNCLLDFVYEDNIDIQHMYYYPISYYSAGETNTIKFALLGQYFWIYFWSYPSRFARLTGTEDSINNQIIIPVYF